MSNTEIQVTEPGGALATFAFGDPESVLSPRDLWGYFEIWRNDRWYEPPLPLAQLASAFNMAPHHRSAIAIKINLLIKHLVPTKWMSRDTFERWALDYLHMGNAYLERLDSIMGSARTMKHAPALWTRAGIEPDTYWWTKIELGGAGATAFKKGSVFHLQQPDVAQEIYGKPEWISALQAALLNEDATLFRRKYYKNGAHMGFVMYINDTIADQDMLDGVKKAFKEAKGPGNFRNLLMYAPGGKKDGVQLLPISDITAKDEFSNIKNISRDDLLAAHRVPPQLIGIIPQNNGGFGDIRTASDVFFAHEVRPIMDRMLEINDWAGFELLRFKDYVQQAPGGAV